MNDDASLPPGIVLKISFQSLVYMLWLFLLPFFYPINQLTIASKLLLLIVLAFSTREINIGSQYKSLLILVLPVDIHSSSKYTVPVFCIGKHSKKIN